MIDIDIDRRIVCLSEADRNIEHVLPEVLGGRLKARLLCPDCNSRFGEIFVADLVRDASVVLAVGQVRESVPALYESVMRNVGYVAPGPDGKPIHIRGERLRARRADDGSILMESSMAASHLADMLEVGGVSSDDIERALGEFADLPDNRDLDMGGGVVVRRRTVETISPNLSADLVDERWPALAAMEYLTLNVGSLVLGEACDSLRDYVQGGEVPEGIAVERLIDRQYEPLHAMYWSQSDQSLDFYVRLFRSVVFRVRLDRIRVRSPLAAYVEELNTGRSLASSNGMAGPFLVLNP